MIEPTYLTALILAGFIYIVTPGPIFLAIVSLVSEKGRKTGFQFILGALFGCMVWLTFTTASLIEADNLPPAILKIISIICAAYLFYLAYKMFSRISTAKPKEIFTFPLRDGFIMALFNPKSYPVMVAVLGSVAANYQQFLTWHYFSYLFIAVVIGFAAGYSFMVMASSLPPIKKFYLRHINLISKLFGLVFIYFGYVLLLGLFE